MSPTPREVFERLLAALTERRVEDAIALYAEDAVVDIPLAFPEPLRFEGREALRAHADQTRSADITLSAHHVVVHETADPEVVIAEFDYEGRVGATGNEFAMHNVQVLRIRDGLIQETRDYHDHLRMAAAFGGLTRLAATLESPAAVPTGA